MKCRTMERRLSRWLDGECPPREAEAIRAHLEGCEGCRAQWNALLRLDRQLRREPPAASRPVDLTCQVMSRLTDRPRPRVRFIPLVAAYAALFLLVFGLTWIVLPGPATPPVAIAASEPEPVLFTALLAESGRLHLRGVEASTLEALGGDR